MTLPGEGHRRCKANQTGKDINGDPVGRQSHERGSCKQAVKRRCVTCRLAIV